MQTVSNPIQACNDIFFRPNGVFRALAENNNWSWLPFFIVIIVTILPQYAYFHSVDFNWYTELLVDAQYADRSPAEQQQFRQQLTPSATISFASVAIFFGYIIINAIIALYLNLATRSAAENEQGFTDWYGMTWWLGMPVVVSSLFALGLILMADGHQITPTVLAPLSIAYLFNIDMSSPWFAFAQSIKLDAFWAIYLMAVGVSQWTRFSTKKSATIAAAPYAIIWAIWLVMIAL
ncbi:YIP1 family protein [Alteromonas sp. ASW11-130]|uniref:YIP1 family protein n=1 Tax=Alteromonas sp. ASW11-130 TaxID=3015775 RepID=UPI0022424BEC|nr:YIP1 family protein [Alteromonas sp. ASW11-130]MCW8093064.1 YIP1 family protein [Alteromonas sp. ASW11-130]